MQSLVEDFNEFVRSFMSQGKSNGSQIAPNETHGPTVASSGCSPSTTTFGFLFLKNRFNQLFIGIFLYCQKKLF
jgi:hypothetical protein